MKPFGLFGDDRQGRDPILVTGVPRSGTTWLARALANAPGTALAGREPMNPRGTQYALGKTLTGWARLTDLTPRQTRLLQSSYRGLNPFVYSRFGHRQWAAPVPGTRIIVKDPFAMLSLPAIVTATSAVPVLLFRDPAAVLSSYRRMSWTADLGEVRNVVPDACLPTASVGPGHVGDALLEAWDMAQFWVALNRQALADMRALGVGLIVSHEELSSGGPLAMQRLYELVGLRWNEKVRRSLQPPAATARGAGSGTVLHNFARSAEQVATESRVGVSEQENAVLSSVAGEMLQELNEGRAILP